MIGKLTGKIDSLGEDWVIVDVGGVGYNVFGSARTLGQLAATQGLQSLYIETHVREDHIHLYGFLEAEERDWFRLLCTVQGVGAKMALAILSVLSPEALIQAIAAQDKRQLARANGVGPKLAGRIVLELKDKAGALALGPAAAHPVDGDGKAASAPTSASEEAISALVNLGYGRAEAFGAVGHAVQRLGQDASLEALVKEGLKELAA